MATDFSKYGSPTSKVTPIAGTDFSKYGVPAGKVSVTKSEEGAKGIKGFGVGALKGVGSTAVGAGQLLEKILPGDMIATPEQFQKAKEYVSPKGTAEKVGFGTEQIAEFLLPSTAVTKGIKVADVGIEAMKAGKLVKGALKLAGRATAEAISAGAVTAIQSGGNAEETARNAGIAALFPVGFGALRVGGKIAKEMSKTIASGLSGVPADAIEFALKNPQTVQTAISKAVQEGEGGIQRVYGQAEDALNTIKKARSDAFELGIKKVQNETMQFKNGQWYVKRPITQADISRGWASEKVMREVTAGAKKEAVSSIGQVSWIPTDLSTKGLKNVTTQTLKEFGVKAKGRALDFTEAVLDKSHANKLDELVQRVYGWKDASPLGLNKLRRIVDSYRLGGINLGSSEKQFNAIVQRMKVNLSEYVGERVPQIAEANKAWSAESEVINGIVDSLKVGRNDQTAMRRLLNVFNPKSSVYRPVVETLGEQGGKDLMGDIAGVLMSKWTPEGLGKYLTTALGGAGAFTAPSLLPGLLAASPRIVGKVATTAGKVSQTLSKSEFLKSAYKRLAK